MWTVAMETGCHVDCCHGDWLPWGRLPCVVAMETGLEESGLFLHGLLLPERLREEVGVGHAKGRVELFTGQVHLRAGGDNQVYFN